MPDNTEDDRSATPPAAAAADNSSATTATGEEDGGVELTLDAVHDELEMTLSNAKKQTRSQATYYKHNLENVRFLLWAYENPDIKSIGEALDPSFVAALDAIKANTQYPAKFSRYRGQELQKKQDKFLTNALKEEIKARLGTPGHQPPHSTLLHEELTADQFGEYLCHKRKDGGETLKPDTYKNFRSGLSFLYRRYGQKMDTEKFEEVSEVLKGVKRISTQKIRRGQGNVERGKREISKSFYNKFNQWCTKKGTKEALFCKGFSMLTWNLACRGDSTGSVCTKNLIWREDAAGIPFSHSKEEQLGDDPRKRLPRHVYCNPLPGCSNVDLFSGLFEYLCVFPGTLADADGPLFAGATDEQASRFSKEMKIILEEHEEEIVRDFGYKISDLGVHSWRKGAHTYMNSGSTAGPTGAATCIRGGHSMGQVRDIYVLQEKAGDHYCGRLLGCLPVEKAEFAASVPEFSPVADGMTEEERAEKQKLIDIDVTAALEMLFGADNLRKMPTIQPFLRHALAASLLHRDELSKMHPDDGAIRQSPLYTSDLINKLKDHVRVAMPWDDGNTAYFQKVTGIPPHVLLLAGQEELKRLVKALVPSMEDAMDNRTMSGVLSEKRMQRIVESSNNELLQRIKGLEDLVRQQNAEGRSAATPGGGAGGATYDMFLHPSDGKLRRVPPNWTFPKGSLLNVYQYWHWGDEVSRIHPIKKLQRIDLAWSSGRHLRDLEEVSFLCGKIDEEAQRKGILATNSDRVATTSIFYDCVDVLGVPKYTPGNRKRNMAKISWSSVLKVMPAEKRKRPTKDASPSQNRWRRRNRSVGNTGAGTGASASTGTGTGSTGTGTGAAGRSNGNRSASSNSNRSTGSSGSRSALSGGAAGDDDFMSSFPMDANQQANLLNSRLSRDTEEVANMEVEAERAEVAAEAGRVAGGDGDGNALYVRRGR